MITFRSLDAVPRDFGPTLATIGNFDGVHRGHRWVISELLDCARACNQRAMAITFDPHPTRILRPTVAKSCITPLARKLELLAATGLDATLVLPFDEAFSRLSARDFAQHVLRDTLQVTEIHEGENFRFGHQAHADIDGLQELGQELGFGVRVFAPQVFRGGIVSSSRVRKLLTAGEVGQARALLSQPFAVDSTPAAGRGYGTRFTVPTINMAPYPELLPAHGVYITTLRIGTGEAAETFQAVTNVGNRPTFGADSFTVESHLLDFHPLSLDETSPLRLTFLKHLRGEHRFPSPEDLRAQIGRDVARAQRFFRLCPASL